MRLREEWWRLLLAVVGWFVWSTFFARRETGPS